MVADIDLNIKSEIELAVESSSDSTVKKRESENCGCDSAFLTN